MQVWTEFFSFVARPSLFISIRTSGSISIRPVIEVTCKYDSEIETEYLRVFPQYARAVTWIINSTAVAKKFWASLFLQIPWRSLFKLQFCSGTTVASGQRTQKIPSSFLTFLAHSTYYYELLMYVLLCILPNGLLMFSCSLSFDCHLISRGDSPLLFCKISEQIKGKKFRNDLPWDWDKFKYYGNFKDYGHVDDFATKEDLDRIEIWGNFFYLSKAGLLSLGFLSTNSINPETLASVSAAEGWNSQSWDLASVIASFSTECSFEKGWL